MNEHERSCVQQCQHILPQFYLTVPEELLLSCCMCSRENTLLRTGNSFVWKPKEHLPLTIVGLASRYAEQRSLRPSFRAVLLLNDFFSVCLLAIVELSPLLF